MGQSRLNLSVPHQIFWSAFFFHPSRVKIFLPCKWGFDVKSYALVFGGKPLRRVKADKKKVFAFFEDFSLSTL